MRLRGNLKGTYRPFGLPNLVYLPAGAIGLACKVAAFAGAYFLTAQFGLALRAQPSDVAVFWPASWMAAGVLISCGRRAYPVLALGVVIGTGLCWKQGQRASLGMIIVSPAANAGATFHEICRSG